MNQKRLLVIDDDVAFRGFIDEVSRTMDYDVVVTGNAEEFQAGYFELKPNVIIMDMVMPGVDGLTLMHWLVEQKCTAKVIVITGFNPSYAEMARTIASGGPLKSVLTLSKPVAITDLRAALA